MIWRTLFLLSFVASTSIFQVQASTLVYVPTQFDPASAKVAVVIHGCLQTSAAMALGTGWNALAEKNNLVVLYPEVPRGTNAADCWNWFFPENQNTQSGQLKELRDEILAWKKRLQVASTPTWVMGISSGGTMAAGLLACFPTEFAGGAIHSSPAYAWASNPVQAQHVMKNKPGKAPQGRPCDPGAFKGKLMVLQGSQDEVVNPDHAEAIILDFLGKASSSEPLKKSAQGTEYAIRDYAVNGKLRGRLIRVEGLGHAWSGFSSNLRFPQLLGPDSKNPTRLPFFESRGPSSTELIWDFLAGHG